MNRHVTTIRRAWQARQRREQWILCGAALIVPLLLADSFVWNPWRIQMKALGARAAQAEQTLQQFAAAPTGTTATPDQQQQVESLRQRLVQAEAATRQARELIVSPERMAAQLRSITQAHGAVNVVALRSLPVTALPDTGGVRLYRHGFELQVEGAYADIAHYIDNLEQTAGVLRWNAVELDASRHPTIAARLEVFTLSEQASWIQL